MLSSMQRKLWRELWHIRGQALAIALVLMGGIAVCIMSLSTYHSLRLARDNYYRDYRFAEVFISLKRAPLSVVEQIQAWPQVRLAEARVVAPANITLSHFNEPIQGLMTSINSDDVAAEQTGLNRLHLVSGRFPDPRSHDEVLVSDAFAIAQGLRPGDHLLAVINGHQQRLRIVGLALSPEHIYQIAPGAAFPDYLRFAVMWMAYPSLARAYDMDGAFNDLVIQLEPGENPASVIPRLDRHLARYGSLGAYDRDDQLSNRFLREEFQQLRMLAIMFPAIFLGVALFLLQVVITRLIHSQRELIAVLKAFGYSNGAVFWHYAQMILVITCIGIAGGFILGLWLGVGMTAVYNQFYRFPQLLYHPPQALFALVALACLLIALLATGRSVQRATALPPAEAMRPAAPSQFRHGWLAQMGLERLLSPAGKMMLRQLLRKPMKSLFSILGLATASGILMVGNFQQDAVDYMVHVQFKLTQKQDIEITFNQPVALKTLYSLRSLKGVDYVEAARNVPVRLHFEQRSYRSSLQGLPDERHLQAVLNVELEDVALPQEGILVSEHLAHKLGFTVGDWVDVEVLEGARPWVRLPVAQLSQQFLGTGVYMRLPALNRLMGEGPAMNGALLNINQAQADQVYRSLREMPQVAGINLRQTVIDSLNDSLERVLLFFTFINAILGSVIAFGVVYNTIRIALAERGRELASLRVLGYTQGEVSYILIGELALLVLASLPLGFLFGRGLCQIIAHNLQSDLYRIPLVLSPYTYAFAAAIVLFSALLSMALVIGRLRQLDLVAVLKTRE